MKKYTCKKKKKSRDVRIGNTSQKPLLSQTFKLITRFSLFLVFMESSGHVSMSIFISSVNCVSIEGAALLGGQSMSIKIC